MTRTLLTRLVWSTVVVMFMFVFVFALVFVAGDPAQTILGDKASAAQIADFKRREGLDQPLGVQMLSYAGLHKCVRRASQRYDNGAGYCGVLQGDLGDSYLHREPVSDVIAHRLPRTLLLGLMAMFFELSLGLSAGIIAALRKQRWIDTAIMTTTFAAISVPTYVTGPVALMAFAFLLGWFPVGGFGFTPAEHLHHGLLPAMILGLAGAAEYARLMRSSLIETLQQDHIRTAHAKGLSAARVVTHHGLRNALLPIVTMVGLSLPGLVSGAIITEKIFAWPGLGSLTVEAIQTLDAPLIMAVVLMFALAVQLGNLIADLAIAALDPRVRD